MESAARGDLGRAVRSVVPLAVQNAVKGVEMWESGEYKDTQGRKVMDVDGIEAFIKGVVFQPSTVAMESAKLGQNMQDINLAKVTESALVDRWSRAIADGKREDLDDVRADLKAWNERNPGMPIRIKPEQIRRRIAEMRKTRGERVLKTASPEMRGALR